MSGHRQRNGNRDAGRRRAGPWRAWPWRAWPWRSWPWLAAVWLSVTVMAVAVARAGDDAGLRSVFAHGAGNRALALGGAYAAVADDASAPVWNPAGLGRLQRGSIYATHTNLIGMGFNEQFASLVLPNWRWGAASLSWRRFGVDGIEQRDDRNILLADDLTDSETEIALGYGKALGESWSVGGTVKMQRQELAEYRDSSLGLDIGVLVRPLLAAGVNSAFARHFAFGLACRNIVEPTLRLDQDDVTDPTGIRAGLAWQDAVGGFGELLLTTDVEKTADMQTRFHAGVEWELQEMLALRLGLNAGDLAAGAGFVWRQVAVDYAFEDNTIASVHRIGVTVAFGPTIEESRLAAVEREEARLEAQLNEAFDDQNRRRVAEMIATTHTALAQDRPEDALAMISAVRVLAPMRDDLTELEMAAYRAQGLAAEAADDLATAMIFYGRCLNLDPENATSRNDMSRVRAEVDTRAARTNELRDIFEKALAAYAAEDYLAAHDGFAAVFAQDPDDAEAEAMLLHTKKAMRLRAGSLAEQCRSMALAGELAGARDALTRARALDPDHPAVARAARTLAEQAGRSVTRAPDATATAGTGGPSPAVTAVLPAGMATPAVNEPPPLSPERSAEIADLYRRGMAAAQANRRDDAVRYWELVWSALPDYQNVGEHLKREYLVRGMEFFAANDIDGAVRQWEKALAVDPDDTRARGYLQRAYEQRARIAEIRSETP